MSPRPLPSERGIITFVQNRYGARIVPVHARCVNDGHRLKQRLDECFGARYAAFGSDNATVTATAIGGNGGFNTNGSGGLGGNATAISSATANGSGNATSFATVTGGGSMNGIEQFPPDFQGSVYATANAETANGGVVEAQAVIEFGPLAPFPSSAFTQSTAKTSFGGVSVQSIADEGCGCVPVMEWFRTSMLPAEFRK